MKFLLPLLSFFLGNAKSLFREPSQAITQQVLLHIRAMTMLVVSTIGSLALACVGLSLFIANVARQLDSSEGFYMTSGSYLFLGMTVIFGGLLLWTLRRETWLRTVGLEEKQTPKKGTSPLENAVALVVMDYLEERQERRRKSAGE